jgi:hypothetical protein
MQKKLVYVKYITMFLFIALLFIPIYMVFVPYENKPEQECWEFRFVWEDFFAFLSYLLLAFFWVLNLFKSNKILRIFLIAFSLLNLIGIFMAGAMPTQDLVPYWGMIVYMILCILVSFYVIRIGKYGRTSTPANSSQAQ